MTLKVLHLSTYDMNGGAARAAYSLHRALLNNGATSRMRVGRKQSDDPTVIQGSSRKFTVNSLLDRQLWRVQKSPRSAWRSPARFSSISASEINSSSADVINLHWVTDGFISIEEIGKIEVPIVWSMYDMWPFSGTEHYGNIDSDRWRDGYTKLNRPADESGLDLDRWTFDRKVSTWCAQTPRFHMVPASTWLSTATQTSALMSTWSITQIPHVVDVDHYKPISRAKVRAVLRLPLQIPLVLFASSAGINDERKGFDLLEQALPLVKQSHPTAKVIILGPQPTRVRNIFDETFMWMGSVTDDRELAALYNAVDVVAVPSREDNLPLIALEAQSCGVPVVSFNVGGMSDIIETGVTGFIANAGSIESLAQGLTNAIDDSLGEGTWGMQARARAIERWSPAIVAAHYSDLYLQVLEGS